MILKSVGAPLSLWEEVSKRSKKYTQHGSQTCSANWRTFKGNCFTVGSLFHLAEKGNSEMLQRIHRDLNMSKDVFFEEAEEFPAIEIDTPFLTPVTATTP